MEPEGVDPASAVVDPGPTRSTSAAPGATPAWPRTGAVLSGAFDLLTQARLAIRDAAVYVGGLGILVLGPLVVAAVAESPRLRVDDLGRLVGPGPSGWVALAALIGVVGALAIGIEAQAIVIAVLGGSRSGRPMGLWEALRRSRMVFWRLVRGVIAVGFVTGLVSGVLELGARLALGSGTDAAAVGANLLTGVITAPFVYVPVGIVLGDVGAAEAIRRSVRLARARFRLAVMASVFAVVAQYLLLLAASSGLDLAVRALEPVRGQLAGLDPTSVGGLAVIGAAVLVVVFAYWTLSVTVLGITAAPQVVAFLALTGYTGGLDAARDVTPEGTRAARPARVSRPMMAGTIAGGALSLAAVGLALR